ncbi:MAG: dihydroorotase [Bacteriovoracaceae bacterium]|jgi:dihydroorotase
MKTLLKNVKTTKHLLGQTGEDFISVEVLISKDIIEQVSLDKIEGNFDQEIDGKGFFLSPGLCDPQVHFREPGLEYKEDIESGSKAAVKGGFTTVISMPNTSPTADNKETVNYMWKKSQEVGICRVFPTGAVTIGLAGNELPNFSEMKEAGAIAFTDDGKGVQKDEIFKAAMIEAKKLNMPVLDHSEDESLSLGGAIHKGEVSNKYGVKGIDSDSESVHVERGCHLSAETGAHYHVLHISTTKSINFVREAKKKGIKVTAEVSPHHLLLCDESIPEREPGELNPNWKMNPPLRSKADREECVKALLDGTIDAIATDHAPHAPHEKAKAIQEAPFGIIGLETAFPLIYTNFVKTNQLSLNKCIDLMSKQAGGLFGLDMGVIKEGSRADLVLFDLESEFEINTEFFASKSQNSPFIGNRLFGKTKLTIFEGKTVFESL